MAKYSNLSNARTQSSSSSDNQGGQRLIKSVISKQLAELPEDRRKQALMRATGGGFSEESQEEILEKARQEELKEAKREETEIKKAEIEKQRESEEFKKQQALVEFRKSQEYVNIYGLEQFGISPSEQFRRKEAEELIKNIRRSASQKYISTEIQRRQKIVESYKQGKKEKTITGKTIKFLTSDIQIPVFVGYTKGKYIGVGKTASGISVGTSVEGLSEVTGKAYYQSGIYKYPLNIGTKKVTEEVAVENVKSVTDLVPRTPLGLGLTTGFIGVYPSLPLTARLGISGGIFVGETKRVFDKTLTTRERKTATILAGLGGAGLLSETTPYLRGIVYRFKETYRPVKVQQEGYEAIKGISFKETSVEPPKITEEIPPPIKPPIKPSSVGTTAKTKEVNIDIGIIPETKGDPTINLPSRNPLKKGAFGYTQKEKLSFLGTNEIPATSQRSFFQIQKDIILEKTFYVSPSLPISKSPTGEVLPITRASRLGIELEPLKFQIGEYGVGLPSKAQIGIEYGARGYKTTPTSELEAVKFKGTKIYDVQSIGYTTYRGVGVQIFKFKTTPSPSIKGIKLIPSTKEGKVVSIESGISSSIGTSKQIPQTSPISYTSTIQKISYQTSPTTSISKSISGYTYSTSDVSSIRTPPPPPPIKPSSELRSKAPPVIPRTTQIIESPTPTLLLPNSPPNTRIDFKRKDSQVGEGTFKVGVRRRGRFETIGTGLKLKEAITLGGGVVSRTISATFKVTPEKKGRVTGGFRTPKGFYQKGTGVFVEKKGLRLSTPTEIFQIGQSKRRKKRK